MATTLDEKHVSEHSKASSIDEKGGLADVQLVAADMNALGSDVLEALEYAKTMSHEAVQRRIQHTLDYHDGDPNFPVRVLDLARQYAEDPNFRQHHPDLYEELKVEMAMITINSPYAEVRAVVDNHNDESEACLSFRVWLIGLVYVAAGAFINQFFDIRQPYILIQANVAQILAYPAGLLLARVLPTRVFSIFGYQWSFNPGPFSKKEHMVITIMANVGFNTPYTANILWVQVPERFFNQPWASAFGYQITTALSTNFIGYGLAGVTRRFLVYPVVSVWPANLAIIALNRAFHDKANENTVVEGGWKLSRMRYFLYCFLGMFFYFWFPSYIFEALSYFNWITWISPDNVALAAITGSRTGLGFNPISTFDWNQLLISGDPLVTPFYSTFNSFMGALITFPVIAAIWWNNVFFTAYLPINSNGVFANTGVRYNVSRVVDENGHFSQEGYENYSPAYLAASNVLVYCLFFAVYTSTIIHTMLYHRFEIWNGLKSLFKRRSAFADVEDLDIHMRLQSKYPEVSEWWYFGVLCASIALGAAGIAAYPTHTTPAVVLYGIFLALIFCVPIGIIKSITNQEITLNVLAELFGGLWFEGDALSMNYFKSYGYVTTAHTIRFAQDLKLAHYMHIPPRVTFWTQTVATVLSTFVCIAVVNFQMTSIENVCDPNQKDRFTCPGINTFFTASVLWGTLGPRKMFGENGPYKWLLTGFLVGAILPFPFYYARQRFGWMKYVHFPVITYGALIWSPYNLANIWPSVPVGFVFNHYIKRRYIGWWSKYNYITSGALTSAVAIAAIVIFFAVQFKSVDLVWWGNTVPYAGCDGAGCSLLEIPEIGHFGPGVGEFR